MGIHCKSRITMYSRLFACIALGMLTAATGAQSAFKAYSQPPEVGSDSPTDLSLAVSKDRVVLVGNDRWHIADKAGNPKITVGTGLATSLPFVNRLSVGRLYDPKAEYDVVHDRIVITMSENDVAPSANRGAIIHMAISKASAVPDDFTSTHWHIFTGDGTVPGTAGAAFMLDEDPILLPNGLDGIADHPTVAIDADYIYLSIRDSLLSVGGLDVKQQTVVIPIVHSIGNLYSGVRVAETEMSFINHDTVASPLRPIADESDLHGSVMETTAFSDDVQFFITTDVTPQTAAPNTIDAIRIGVLRETAPPSGGSPATFDYQYKDLAVVGATPLFSKQGRTPITPDSPTYVYAGAATRFETAVRHLDPAGNDNIYAIHDYRENVSGTPASDYTSRWYVIDPDAANAGTLSWTPGIVGTGVIPQPPSTQVDTFHAAIAVNNLGQLGLSWTASNATTDPQMEYGLFKPATSTLTTGVHVFGPSLPYVDQDQGGPSMVWADYSDIQLDPVGCRFYATATLVGTTPGSTIAGTVEDRDAWIGIIPFNCFTTDMNMSGFTDTYDMMMYTGFYTAGDKRADTNADGEVDAGDMATFTDAYDKATGR